MNEWMNLRLIQASLDPNHEACWHLHSGCDIGHVHRDFYVLPRMLPIDLSKALLNGTRTGGFTTQTYSNLPNLFYQLAPISPRPKNAPSSRFTSLFLSEQNWKILVTRLFYIKEILQILHSNMCFSLRRETYIAYGSPNTYIAYGSPNTLASIWKFGRNDHKVNI